MRQSSGVEGGGGREGLFGCGMVGEWMGGR